ncbi:hypothetical protein CLU79DRAFT_715674 [Phycomyces nitens]|nr:hypothetical protein CLU79DRAFT_715674 [Phycomyces nitens]
MTVTKNLTWSSNFPSSGHKPCEQSRQSKVKKTYKKEYIRRDSEPQNTFIPLSFINGNITDKDQIQKKIETTDIQEIDRIISAYESNLYRLIKQYCAQQKYIENTKEAEERLAEISRVSTAMNLFFTSRLKCYGPRLWIKPKAWHYNLRNKFFATRIPKLRLLGSNFLNPQDRVFGSIDDYLSIFETTITTRKEDINSVWSKWLPESLGKEHEQWYDENLKDKLLPWEQVKQLLREKFDIYRQLEINGRIYKIMAKNNDPITLSSTQTLPTHKKSSSLDNKSTDKPLTSFSPSLYRKVKSENNRIYTSSANTRRLPLRSNNSLASSKRERPQQCNPELRKYVDVGAGYSRHRLAGTTPSKQSKLFCPMARKEIICETKGCRELQLTAYDIDMRVQNKTCRHCHELWSHKHYCSDKKD